MQSHISSQNTEHTLLNEELLKSRQDATKSKLHIEGIQKILSDKEGEFQKLQWDNQEVIDMKKEFQRSLKSHEFERDKVEAKADVLNKEKDRVVNDRQKDLEVIRKEKNEAITTLKLSHSLELQNRDKIIDELNIENIKMMTELKKKLRGKQSNEESFRKLNEHVKAERQQVRKNIDELEQKLSKEKLRVREEVHNKNNVVREKNAAAQKIILIEELLQKAKNDIQLYKQHDKKRAAEHFTLETELQKNLHETSQQLNQTLFKLENEKKRFDRDKHSVEAELALSMERSELRIEEAEKAVSTLSNAKDKEKKSFDSALSTLTTKRKEQNKLYEDNILKEQELGRCERGESIEIKKEVRQVTTEKLELSVALEKKAHVIYHLEDDVRGKEDKILAMGERIRDLLSIQDDFIIRERNVKREVRQLKLEVRRE